MSLVLSRGELLISNPLTWIRATSHTFIGGKGGAGPSSLHITLEGPTEYVDARWM